MHASFRSATIPSKPTPPGCPSSRSVAQRSWPRRSTAAQRGAGLTQRLLAFARKQALDPKAVDLNQLVSGMEAMLHRTLGEHIEIELIRATGLWRASVDQGQLENALLNLCINARDAMPGGGRLTLETANVRLDAEYADRNGEVLPGPYVMLAVSDTGHGIAPENLPRVMPGGMNGRALADASRSLRPGLRVLYTSGYTESAIVHLGRLEPGAILLTKPYLGSALGRALRSALAAPSCRPTASMPSR